MLYSEKGLFFHWVICISEFLKLFYSLPTLEFFCRVAEIILLATVNLCPA